MKDLGLSKTLHALHKCYGVEPPLMRRHFPLGHNINNMKSNGEQVLPEVRTRFPAALNKTQVD